MTELTFKLREEGRKKREAKRALQHQMVTDFADHLENRERRLTLYRDTNELPHPKDDLIDAILLDISETDIKAAVPIYAAAALALAYYQPGLAREKIEMPDATALEAVKHDARAFWELMGSFDPKKVSELGDIADKEIAEITRWIENAKRANPNFKPFYVRWWRGLTRYP